MNQKEKVVVCWYRRDLRLKDNKALYYAVQSGYKVLPIFVFDKDILEQFPNKADRRVDYIHQVLTELNAFLKQYNAGITFFHSTVKEAFSSLMAQFDIQGVFYNEDYEPKTIARDREIGSLLAEQQIAFNGFKDHVIFRGDEILKQDGSPYQIYTPYAKLWRSKLGEQDLYNYTPKLSSENLYTTDTTIPSLNSLGYETTGYKFVIPTLNETLIDSYHLHRDYPGIEGTTHLGIALRFGTISIRKCVIFALQHNDVWLSELIWRDFFSQILFNFPQIENLCFKPKYENIQYRNNEEEFKLWCEGRTGYPIVDAGMRELNTTGFMHNRVRMIVASFLTKHLLIDWRWGEAYFAQHLLDYDLSANNGNWQWAAGCGCDAAPYFRIFNPSEQTKKFDKENKYINKWLPELAKGEYWEEIVDHKEARIRALETYKRGLVQ